MPKLYTEHEGRVVSADNRFKHIMAIALDPRTNHREGILRCITSRDGTFSIGLFIYDYEQGKVDWVSSDPFIQDSEAGKGGNRAITFASQFVETNPGEGILYAHVDDSFVRAYTLKADLLKSILPTNSFNS